MEHSGIESGIHPSVQRRVLGGTRKVQAGFCGLHRERIQRPEISLGPFRRAGQPGEGLTQRAAPIRKQEGGTASRPDDLVWCFTTNTVSTPTRCHSEERSDEESAPSLSRAWD